MRRKVGVKNAHEVRKDWGDAQGCGGNRGAQGASAAHLEAVCLVQQAGVHWPHSHVLLGAQVQLGHCSQRFPRAQCAGRPGRDPVRGGGVPDPPPTPHTPPGVRPDHWCEFRVQQYLQDPWLCHLLQDPLSYFDTCCLLCPPTPVAHGPALPPILCLSARRRSQRVSSCPLGDSGMRHPWCPAWWWGTLGPW